MTEQVQMTRRQPLWRNTVLLGAVGLAIALVTYQAYERLPKLSLHTNGEDITHTVPVEPEAAMVALLATHSGAKLSQWTKLDMLNGELLTDDRYRVEVEFQSGALWGSAQDFNSLAGELMPLAKRALQLLPKLERLRFVAREKSGVDWAIVEVRRSDLVANWQALTYLQLWSEADVDVPQLQARPWLCEFERKYRSAAARKHHACTASE